MQTNMIIIGKEMGLTGVYEICCAKPVIGIYFLTISTHVHGQNENGDVSNINYDYWVGSACWMGFLLSVHRTFILTCAYKFS